MKIVGLTFSDNLRWESHINNTVRSAKRAYGFLKRASRFLSRHALHVVYKSHVRSVMEYACPIWMGGSKSALTRLDRIQDRIKALIGPTLSSDLQSLAHRRGVAGFCVFHRLVHESAPQSLHNLAPTPIFIEPKRSTRSTTNNNSRTSTRNVFILPSKIPGYAKAPAYWYHSFIPMFTTAWNRRLSYSLQNMSSLQKFKSRVNKELDLTHL